MLQENISIIANYLWKKSIQQINNTLTEMEVDHFNMNDYYYLTVIYQLEKPKLGQLAEELQLTKPAISALVKRLLKNDLIEKTQSTEDKRIFYLNVTEKGLNIIQGDLDSYEKLSKLIIEATSKDELLQLNQLLDEVVKHLQMESFPKGN
ncbi:MarR family winged helix-turn-helix transcriptional regulator [Bacillus sp. 03113]|uniref:MarR family winged helix-turn-helix transcriptional regulator n=1 Tax=Bacillus sp. 03113 TaxID=2578211 RepID=UPI00114405BA|nr:MarR family transcriptional regulator [Bacillus sp. 03113]